MVDQSWGEKAREIPNPTEFMLLNTYKSFKIRQNPDLSAKVTGVGILLPDVNPSSPKTCSRSLVPSLEIFHVC